MDDRITEREQFVEQVTLGTTVTVVEPDGNSYPVSAKKLFTKNLVCTKPEPKPYRKPKEVYVPYVILTEAVRAMPVLMDDIVEEIRMQMKLKHSKNRHCNIRVPLLDEFEQRTGKLARLRVDILESTATVKTRDGE